MYRARPCAKGDLPIEPEGILHNRPADRIQTVKNVATNTNYDTLTYMAPGGVKTMTLGNGITKTDMNTFGDRKYVTVNRYDERGRQTPLQQTRL